MIETIKLVLTLKVDTSIFPFPLDGAGVELAEQVEEALRDYFDDEVPMVRAKPLAR